MDNKEKYLEQILKLSRLLLENEVEHELDVHLDGYSVRIKNYEAILADATIHSRSYGHNDGLFEIYGALTEEESKNDNVLGYLSVEEVAKRFKYCYEHKTDDYVKETK